MRLTTTDVTILGAGPYGLAAGAHLRQIKGLELRIFGEPMEFWSSHMPEGMLLRSPWEASHISDPQTALTMEAFADRLDSCISTPIPLDRFVEYGLWFQRQAVPDVDRRKITRIEKNSSGFRLTLVDGEQFNSRRVVIAAGIGSFARWPQQFEGLPCELVTHASNQRGIRRFQGKRVVVMGAGQSALECAALIHEAGGDVEVIVKAPNVHWLGWRARLQKLGPIAKLLYSPATHLPNGHVDGNDRVPVGASLHFGDPDLVDQRNLSGSSERNAQGFHNYIVFDDARRQPGRRPALPAVQ